MSGIVDLDVLLKDMQPKLQSTEYVFCTIKPTETRVDVYQLDALAIIREDEGVTLILERRVAEKLKFLFEGTFKKITLHVHSSLTAVGLTAAFSTELAKNNISANVIAGYYHDHIFVPSEQAGLALKVLTGLTK